MSGKNKNGIIRQVATLFAVGVLLTGMMTYFTQHAFSDARVKRQTEEFADEIADEVNLAIKEYPAWEWLIRYWYANADAMDVEYDVEFTAGTETQKKTDLLQQRHPELSQLYADEQTLSRLPAEDQKLYAEVAYSWLITRVDEIKRAFRIDYLFCVLTDDTFETQFFLLSGADPGAVRGTNYEEVYTLGTTVTVSESQQTAMREAVKHSAHLADAGKYVDYYALVDRIDGKTVLIGMTYNLTDLLVDVDHQTWNGTVAAIVYQICLSVICLGMLLIFVLQPLKKVQQNIRLYQQTKDSRTVTENLSDVRLNNEIGQLSDDVQDLAVEMDQYMDSIRTITAEKERISSELALATRIQEDMLPNTYPAFPERAEFDIYASMTPAKEVGGDFYNYFLIDEDHLCLMIADVSGKGIPAALFMMASMIVLSNLARMGKSPAQIFKDANNGICANNREEMFVTAWLGILELSTGTLTAANAGHEYPVIRRADGSFALYRDPHGLVIGAMEGVKYRDYTLRLEPGAKLFVYTDGVPEAADADKQMFGTERMLDALNTAPDAAPKEVLERVQTAVDAFVQDAEQFDDLTMLCLSYNGPLGEQK